MNTIHGRPVTGVPPHPPVREVGSSWLLVAVVLVTAGITAALRLWVH
jgi:hypothetical protein